MKADELIRLPDPHRDVRVEVREIVRDVFEKPHVFVRGKLTGWFFPGRALEPFAVVGDVVSRFVVLGPDSTSASAYFDRPLPRARRVSFGYGNIILWDFDVEIDVERIDRLDRNRLPRGVVDPFSEPPG
jgi:hypothetical protein